MRISEFIRYYSLQELENTNYDSHNMPLHQLWNWEFLKDTGYEMSEAKPDTLIQKGFWRQLFMDNKAQQKASLNQKPDLLYAPFMGDAYYIALLKCLHLCNVPLIAIAQDTWNLDKTSGLKNRFKYQILRFLAKNGVDKLLFISEGVFEQCKGYFNNPQKHIPLHHWGVDIEYYDNYITNQTEKPTKDFLFVTGGANRDFNLMQKLALLKDCPIKIFVQTNRCPLDIRNSTNFVIDRTPSTWNDLLHGYYNSMAVAVPLEKKLSYLSGITVVMEGMACNKPVLSTETNLYPFNLEKEKAGFYLPYGDEKAWKDAVQYLIDNPEEAIEMGNRGRYLVEHKHNYKIFCEELKNHIESLKK